MPAKLDSSRLKLIRAREHVVAVKESVEVWLGTDAYAIVREKDPETGDTVARAQIKASPPTDLSVLIGDAVQNFRAALDHAIYALAERHTPGGLTVEIEGALMFPLVGNQNSKGQPADGSTIFANLIQRGQLYGVPGDAIKVIQQEQPYHWSGDEYVFETLWALHELSRIDKHRRLAVTTAWLDVPYLSAPLEVESNARFTRAEGPVQDGDVLVTYAGADEGVHAHFTRDVSIDEPTLRLSDRSVGQTLDLIDQRVQWVVAVLERFL